MTNMTDSDVFVGQRFRETKFPFNGRKTGRAGLWRLMIYCIDSRGSEVIRFRRRFWADFFGRSDFASSDPVAPIKLQPNVASACRAYPASSIISGRRGTIQP